MATKAAPKAAAKTATKSTAKTSAKSQVAGDGAASTEEAEGVLSSVLRVRDLIDRVATSANQNKKDVRAIVEATLTEMGKSLETGSSMNLPPFGKVRIANHKSDASGQVYTLKLRRGGEEKSGKKAEKQALANDGEDS